MINNKATQGKIFARIGLVTSHELYLLCTVIYTDTTIHNHAKNIGSFET
jgi:hypothetical protein